MREYMETMFQIIVTQNTVEELKAALSLRLNAKLDFQYDSQSGALKFKTGVENLFFICNEIDLKIDNTKNIVGFADRKINDTKKSSKRN